MNAIMLCKSQLPALFAMYVNLTLLLDEMSA